MADNKTQIIITAQDQTAGAISSATAGLSKLKDVASGLAPSLAGAFSGAAIAAFVKSAVDAGDELHDLSQKTGIAVDRLAAYKLAADQSGTSLDSVAKGMGKLSAKLVENGDAFKKLGIDTGSLDTAMADISEVFADMPDGVEKSALALALFGKNGADLIPLLNLGKQGLHESAEASARYGEAMKVLAPQADKFNDTLAEIALNSKASGAELANAMLPTLQLLADEFLDASKNSDAFKTAGEGLNQLLLGLAATGAGIVATFSVVGKTIGAAAAQLVAVGKGDFKGALSIGAEWQADIGKAKEKFDSFVMKLGQPAKVSINDGLKDTGKSASEAEKRAKAMLAALKGGAESAKKPVDELAQLLNRLNTKDSGLDASYWKDLQTLFAGYQSGRLSVESYSDAVAKLTNQQKFAVDAAAAAKKAEDDYQKSVEKAREEVTHYINALEDKAAALEEDLQNYGKTKAEIEGVTIARLEEQRAMVAGFDSQEELVANLDREISARQRLRNAMEGMDAADAAKKAAEKSAKAWEKFASDIEQSLTDSLYRSFEAGQSFGESFVKSLQNTIKSASLKFAVQVIVGTGGNMVAQAADSVLGTKFSGSGALNNMSSIGSALNLFSAGGASGASLAAANATGALGGDALGALIAGNASSWGVSAAGVEGMASVLGGVANASTAATAAAGAAEGAATAAAGAASAMSWALPALGAIAFVATNFKKIVGGQKSMGDGVQIVGSFDNNGFSGMQGQDWQKSGGWFGKKKDGVDWSAVSPEMDAAFDDLYRGVKTGLIDIGKRLGDDSIAGLLDGFSMAVDQKSFIQVLSVTANGIAIDLVKSMLDKVAPVVNDVMSRTGSTDWAGTLNTMTAQAIGVDNALKLVGTSLEGTFGQQKLNDVLWVTDQFARMFGSVETMGNQLSAYVQNFYSESEISSKAWSAMGEQFAAIGETMPETKAGFRSLVESLDLTTESGRQTFASLMNLSPAFAQLAGASEALQQKILEQRTSWQNKLDVLTGATTDRQLQMQSDLASTTDAATQALIRQVYAQEDLRSAASAAAEAAAQAAAEAQQRSAAVASERYGLETQLLQAQGDTVALRERERAALDESNRALQDQIWALEDAKAAADAAAQAAQESAQAEAARQAEIQQQAAAAAQAAAAIASERDGLQKQLWQAQGNTVALRAAELAALNPANRALQEQIYALQDLATAAQKAAQVESERLGLQKQLWQLQGNTAALREAELAALDPANRALQQQIWALQDSKQAADDWTRTWENLNQSLRNQAKKLRNEIGGQTAAGLQAQFAIATAQARSGDSTAAAKLVGLSDQLLSAFSQTAGSALEVAQMSAQLADSLDTTATTIEYTAPDKAGRSAEAEKATVDMAADIRQLRAENMAQAAAMARLLTEMARITSRWDRDGMPTTRVEAV